MGNGLEQWRASIGLFNSKCIIKQRVRVNVSMAFIFTYMMFFLKWAVNKSQPSYYRPVALLSCIGKLQERIFFKKKYV